MGLSDHSGWGEQARTALLALPLVLVVLAAAFAATSGNGAANSLSRMLTGYPIRIDLSEVEQITNRKDLARRSPLASGQEAEQEANGAADQDTLLIDPLLVPPAAANEIAPAAGESRQVDRVAPSAPSASRAAAGLASGGVMALDYDLAGGPQSASALQVRKEVQHDGETVGRVEIRIDNNSAIYVARADLVRIVPSASDEAERLGSDFVPLVALREAGINLRYDPVSDRLVLRD